jgi:hypothetical protein
MTTIERAEQLRQQAINLLLIERSQIDNQLNQLGYEKAPNVLKRRGRPPKSQSAEGAEVQPQPADHS